MYMQDSVYVVLRPGALSSSTVYRPLFMLFLGLELFYCKQDSISGSLDQKIKSIVFGEGASPPLVYLMVHRT